MESNGEPGRIQVSQTTADLIKRAGKEHWLTARVDMVVAKGLGELQTFWCDPHAVESAMTDAGPAS
jgi:hypothetical protein